MLSKENTINLEDFRVTDGTRVSKVFTGRDRGKFVREKSKIDELETMYESINIIIPNNVYSINPSFFEEFIINVVTKLGKEEFLRKFNFTFEGEYQFPMQLEQAIDRILKNKTALD